MKALREDCRMRGTFLRLMHVSYHSSEPDMIKLTRIKKVKRHFMSVEKKGKDDMRTGKEKAKR